MFKEIATMLRKGDTVSVIIAPENETQLRVNVFPKLFTLDGEKSPDRAALNQPLTVVGTADELDAGFAGMLTKFSSSVTGLRTTLDEAEATHKEAAKKDKPKPAAAKPAKPAKPAAKAAAKPVPKDEHPSESAAPAAGTMDLLAEDPEPAPEPAAEPEAAAAGEGEPADEGENPEAE